MTNQTLDILNPSGILIRKHTLSANCTRKFSLMSEDSVTLRFWTREAMKFPVGSSIGDFFITQEQVGKWNANSGVWDYELKFDAYYWLWSNKILRYIIPGVDSARETSFTLTATIETHANVILNCLGFLGIEYGGSQFRVDTDGTVTGEAKLVRYENLSVLGGIQAIAEAFECEWWVSGNAIYFGRCENGDSKHVFEAGINTSSITFQQAKSEAPNRLYVYGSDRNLPPNYREVDGNDTIGGVVVRRLMLPEGTPYLQTSPDIPEAEIVEKVVVLDSVYPRTDLTVSEEPETYTSKGEDEEGNATSETFYRLKYDVSFLFSESYVLPNEELHIVFQSGLLNGMDFGAKFNPKGLNEKNSDGSWNPGAQMIEIVANEDYGRNLPDEILKPQKGDKFILYGWDSTKMADLGLIAEAEQELLEEGEKALEEYSKDLSTCTCPMAWDYMKPLFATNSQPKPGDVVTIIDTAHFGEGGRKSRIIGFEYKLDKPYAECTYTCGENVSTKRLDSIEKKIEGLAKTGSKVQIQNSLDFLSKRYSDRTPYKLSSDKGFEVGDYVSGVSGAMVGNDAQTGKTFAEVDYLYARVKAYFESLTVIEANTLAGKQYITPGGSVKCTKVEEVKDTQGNVTAYRCYFLSEQDGEKTDTKIIAGDQAISEMFNAKEGTANKVSNHRWWRLVTAVSNDAYTDDAGNHYGYIEVSASDCEAYSDIPQEGDVIAQLGNCTDATRQSAMVFSTVDADAPSIKMYSGIGSGNTLAEHYSLNGKAIISFGRDPLNNQVYFRLGNSTATQYLDYTQQGGLKVAGKIVSTSAVVDADGNDTGTLGDILNRKVVLSTSAYFLSQNEGDPKPSAPTKDALGSWSTASPDWTSGKAIWQTTRTDYTDGTTAFSDPVCVSGRNGKDGQPGAPGSDGSPGADGKYPQFQWARNSSSATAPTSGWQDTPITSVPAGEYVWQHMRMYDPSKAAGAQEAWGAAIRLTGDKGNDGQSVYMLDLSNEVAGVACDASGTVTGALPSSAISVYKGAILDSGWSFSVKSATGCTAEINGSTLSVKTLTADDASVTVQATKTGVSVTLEATMNVYKVRPGAAGGKGDTGDAAVVYQLEPSVGNVSRFMNGTTSVSTVTCAVYKTTGADIREVATSGYKLKYQRTPDDAAPKDYTPTGAAITASTESVVFELYDTSGTKLLDRERVPVVADGNDLVAVKGEADDAKTKAEAAQKWIGENAPELSNIKTSLSTYDYLKEAIKKGATVTSGGLNLMSQMKLGTWDLSDIDNPVMTAVNAGINGINNANGNAPMLWGGGDMVDRFYDASGNKLTNPLASGFATSMIRMDGSAYFANGNVGWENDGSGWLGDRASGKAITFKDGSMTFGSGIVIDLGGGNTDTLQGLSNTISSLVTSLENINQSFIPVYLDGTTPKETTWGEINKGNKTLWAIKSAKGLYTDEFISAKGLNPGGSSSGGGATELRLLDDVLIGDDLEDGQALVYNGGRWVNRPVSTEIADYLTANDYARKSDLAPYLKADGSNGTAAGVSTLVRKLSEATGDITDITSLVTSDNVGDSAGGQYYRRPASKLWNYVRGKADTRYQPIGDYYTKTEADGLFLGVTGNAASATKLADNTEYKAWGQPFFENGVPKEVSGALSSVTSISMNNCINATRTNKDIDLGLNVTSGGRTTQFVNGISGNRGIYDQTNSRWAFAIATDGNTHLLGGNVGIGTTSPAYKLDVSGEARFSNTHINANGIGFNRDVSSGNVFDTTKNGGQINFSTSYNGIEFGTVIGSTKSYSVRAVLKADNGNFGIGTTTPSYKLDVNGSIRTAASLLFAKGSIASGGETYIQVLNGTSAHGLAVGGLLVSNSYADYAKVPANGIYAKGEVVSASFNSYRIAYGNYGFFLRNDGVHSYFLLTAAGDQYGSYNSLRPLYINNSTGLVTMQNGLKVNSVTIGDCEITWDGTGLHFSKGIYSDGFVSSHGSNASSGGGGAFALYTNWTDTPSDQDALSGILGKELHTRLSAIEGEGYVTLDGAQTITGAKTFNGVLTLGNATIKTTAAISIGPSIGDAQYDKYHRIDLGYHGYDRINVYEAAVNFYSNASGTAHTIINATSLTAPKFIKSGGTSSQFLKADGSVDSNSYALSSSLGNYLPLTGGTLTGLLHVNVNGTTFDIGGQNASWVHLYSNKSCIFNKDLYVMGNLYAGSGYNQIVWHSGNDGTGSGLDADLLDGYHAGSNEGQIPVWRELGKYGSVNNGDTGETSNNKNFLRRITGSSSYGAKLGGTCFLGTLTPNSQRFIVGRAYDDTAHTDGMPRYSYFLDLFLGGTLMTFGTNNGAYYEKTFAFLDSNVASANKLFDNTARTAWGQTFFSNGQPQSVTGLLTATTGASHSGIKLGNAYLSAINGEVIFQNLTAIRFGTDDWDYNKWAGLKYDATNKIIYLGLADGSIFTKNGNALTGGTVNLVNCGLTANGNIVIQQALNTYNSRLRLLESSNYQGAYIGYDGTNNVLNIGVHEANDSLTTSDINAISILRSNAYVGIGTSTPAYKLHVNGTAYATKGQFGTSISTYALNAASFICDSWVRSKGATGWYNETHGGGWYMTDTTWIRNYNNKNLYMNSAVIRTDGQIQVGADGGSFLVTSAGEVTAAGDMTCNTLYARYGLRFKKDSGNSHYIMVDNDTRNLQVCQTTDGAYQATRFYFTWDGAFYAKTGIFSDGYVSARGQNTSDIRLKTDIKDFRASGIIKALHPVSFRWNAMARSRFKVLDTDAVQYGLIAQETVTVAPWLVDENMFRDGLWGVKYEKLIPVLTQGVREVTFTLDDLTVRVKSLEKSNKRLESENRELRRMIKTLEQRKA